MDIKINSLWIGGKLGEVHAACLSSFVRVGYSVVLHCYEKPSDLPKGVDVFDANRLMRPEEVIRHKATGSFALASDIYRYRILQKGLGIYVDADIYCLKPLPENPYLFGYEDNDRVNGAVLNIPEKSQLLKDILRASEDPYFIPPWSRKAKIRFEKFRKCIGLPRHVSQQRWGTLGPSLITHFVRENNLSKHVLPIDILYPLHYGQVDLLFERGLKVADIATFRTCVIHLYNNIIKNRDFVPDTPIYQIITNAV